MKGKGKGKGQNNFHKGRTSLEDTTYQIKEHTCLSRADTHPAPISPHSRMKGKGKGKGKGQSNFHKRRTSLEDKTYQIKEHACLSRADTHPTPISPHSRNQTNQVVSSKYGLSLDVLTEILES